MTLEQKQAIWSGHEEWATRQATIQKRSGQIKSITDDINSVRKLSSISEAHRTIADDVLPRLEAQRAALQFNLEMQQRVQRETEQKLGIRGMSGRIAAKTEGIRLQNESESHWLYYTDDQIREYREMYFNNAKVSLKLAAVLKSLQVAATLVGELGTILMSGAALTEGGGLLAGLGLSVGGVVLTASGQMVVVLVGGIAIDLSIANEVAISLGIALRALMEGHDAVWWLKGPRGGNLGSGEVESGADFVNRTGKNLSFPEQSWYTHTEGKLIWDLIDKGLLKKGTTLTISGTLLPC